MWRLRRAFWNWLLVLKFVHAKPLVIPAPGAGDRPIVPVPFATKFPDIPIDGVVVADHVPSDEAQGVALRFCQFQAALARRFPPMQWGLPAIDADPQVALANAYTAGHLRCYPAPSRPPEHDGPVDLGRLAVASPYACYLEADGDAGFRWDLRSLERFECHPGLQRPAALVEFAVDDPDQGLVATRIDCELGSSKPGDPDWAGAQRLALCAVTNHLSLVRHFNWIHLVCGGPLGFVTRNCLPVDHPVRVLLQPHVFATQSSNEMVTIDQMTPGGDFENVFSFTHTGMCELFEATCGEFDLRMIDPALDAGRRGVAAVPFATPAFENRSTLMTVIRDHVARYLALYFDTDTAVGADQPLAWWLQALGALVPGVTEMAGSPVTLEGAALVLSTLIYLTTVEHEIVGSGVWNYQLWSDVQPTRVYRGQRPPLDVYQRLVNANFNLNVVRTPLMSDFSSLALDGGGADAFRRFRSDLAGLQVAMAKEPATCWRMEPRMLKANINA